MKVSNSRLFFIDAMRAWAILMMLQGHFIDGLLDPLYRNPENTIFGIWLYFRGITAPVFFTVSGFIFTYLLLKSNHEGHSNPRIRKGIRRGLQLLLIGYALRLNLFGLFKGEVYSGFYLVDVLHCIGLSILTIIMLYRMTLDKRKILFPVVLVSITFFLFFFEPLCKQWSFSLFPTAISNYFTKANGSVFTIIPWLGYTTLGGALSLLFIKFKHHKNLYPIAIFGSLILGFILIYFSSPFFMYLFEVTGFELFQAVYSNNYLFIRLGDVFVVFAIFMLLRKFLMNDVLLKIGSNTLSIYVLHFIILYGSFTGLGLYKFFHNALTPSVVILGAGLFMLACTYLALLYDRNEIAVKAKIGTCVHTSMNQLYLTGKKIVPLIKNQYLRIRLFLTRFFAIAKN